MDAACMSEGTSLGMEKLVRGRCGQCDRKLWPLFHGGPASRCLGWGGPRLWQRWELWGASCLRFQGSSRGRVVLTRVGAPCFSSTCLLETFSCYLAFIL